MRCPYGIFNPWPAFVLVVVGTGVDPVTFRFPGGQSPGTDAVVVTRMVTRPNVPAHVGL